MLIDTAFYHPQMFDVATVREAKDIILYGNYDVDFRWENETKFIMTLLESFELSEKSCVLDYGCGIGRIAREIIKTYGCSVIGVDISPRMRSMAIKYVDSSKFTAVSTDEWDNPPPGLERRRVDLALAIWVLQHCKNPTVDIGRIRRALLPSGKLFVVNDLWRSLPVLFNGKPQFTSVKDDDVDVWGLIRFLFKQEYFTHFKPIPHSFFGIYKQREDGER